MSINVFINCKYSVEISRLIFQLEDAADQIRQFWAACDWRVKVGIIAIFQEQDNLYSEYIHELLVAELEYCSVLLLGDKDLSINSLTDHHIAVLDLAQSAAEALKQLLLNQHQSNVPLAERFDAHGKCLKAAVDVLFGLEKLLPRITPKSPADNPVIHERFHGHKVTMVKLLAHCMIGNKLSQDLAREIGAIPLLLNQLNFDDNNPSKCDAFMLRLIIIIYRVS